MFVKFIPCKHDIDSSFVLIDSTTISIDGEIHTFPEGFIKFPSVDYDTGGVIKDAYRENGELYLTVVRFFSDSCDGWGTGEYQRIEK